jgi:hypothetical protein
MNFRIEKGVPLPERKAGRRQLYPFTEMKAGSSFLAPIAAELNIRAAASYQNRTTKMRFAVHRMPNGIRVWRVK